MPRTKTRTTQKRRQSTPLATLAAEVAELKALLQTQLDIVERHFEALRDAQRSPEARDEGARYLSEGIVSTARLSARLADTRATIAFCERHFADLRMRGLQEEVHLLTLDSQHRVQRSHLVAVGLLNQCPMHAREVFRPALLDAAQAIILVHNHPSGIPTPSAEDRRVTDEMVAAGKLLKIPLLDHVIVAAEGCASVLHDV